MMAGAAGRALWRKVPPQLLRQLLGADILILTCMKTLTW